MIQAVRYDNVKIPKWIFVIIVGLLLPPIISMVLSLFYAYQNKDKNYLIPFSIFFVLFLTYNFFSIDNIGRLNFVYSTYGQELWYLGDPLSNIMRYGVRALNLECSHFFYIYILFVYLFFFKTLKQCYDGQWNIDLFLIFVTTISLRNSIDLLYYCLSTAFMCYYITRKDKFSILNYFLLIIVVYLLHPGLLIILLPAICLNFSIKLIINNRKWFYYISLIVIYFIYFFLAKTSVTSVGIPVIDSVLSAFSAYTSDSYWGVRDASTAISGISYMIMYYVIPGIYFILFIVSILKINKMKKTFLVAVFQAAMLMYPNFMNYVTFTERTLLVLSITFILLLVMIYKDTLRISIKWVVLYCLLIFIFTSYKGAGAVRLNNVFEQGSYTAIKTRSYYMPCALLFDYHNWGYSDEFVRTHTHVTY